VVIRKRGGLTGASFTVRKVSYGVGVERIFPVHSPNLDQVVVLFRGKVRQSRLYYLRDRKGKAARIKEKRSPVL
jgi:large subunit ribosomal protein L19